MCDKRRKKIDYIDGNAIIQITLEQFQADFLDQTKSVLAFDKQFSPFRVGIYYLLYLVGFFCLSPAVDVALLFRLQASFQVFADGRGIGKDFKCTVLF